MRLTSTEAYEALDAMDVAVVLADVINGGSWVTWVNPAFTRVFGYTREDMVDGALQRLIGPESDVEEVVRMYRAVLGGERATATTVGYCADGTAFWSTFTMSPVRVDGRTVRWVGIQHDVTDYIRQSEQDRRSYEVERRARDGLVVVGAAADLMVEVGDPFQLRSVARMLQGRLLAWAGFFVVDDGVLRAVESVEAESGARRRDGAPSEDPVARALADEDQASAWMALDCGYSSGTPAATLVSLLAPNREAFANAADQVLLVPVVGRRRTLAVLAALPRATDMKESADAEDVRRILELLARRVGLAWENAELYAREHRVAETLQRSMLPEQEHIADLDVWSYYAPNARHAQVGGDWYDVVRLAGGAVGVVVGDVAGHDIEAAATMGQLRSVVRAYAVELGDPGKVLARVDSLAAGMRMPRYASLVFAVLTADGEDWVVTYSRAGHIPPLLVHDGATRALDGAPGPLIGLQAAERATASVRAVPGDLLVFFTDGLVERRTRSLKDGAANLAEFCGKVRARDAAGVGEELLATFAREPEDDVAVVVVRIPDANRNGADDPASPRRRRWRLPAEAGSIGRARHAVRNSCANWGVEDPSAAELIVSELVANAVLHAWGTVTLRLEDAPEGLLIEVADDNPTPPAADTSESAERDEAGRVGGYGMHIVDRLAEWGWRPEGEGKVVWARLRERERPRG